MNSNLCYKARQIVKGDILPLKATSQAGIVNMEQKMKQAARLLALILLLSACAVQFAPSPVAHELQPALSAIPVYPEAGGWNKGILGVNQESETSQTFSYTVNVFKYKTLVNFYEEEMVNKGWELLLKSEDSKTNSAELMFARSKTVAHIQMIPWTANSYLVYVVFYEDPVLEK
jgi:hypothetical protein